MIDSHTVVRLKFALRPDPFHWGTRTDYVFAREKKFDSSRVPFLLYDGGMEWKAQKKPSTGLCAIYQVAKLFKPPQILLIGFDSLLNPSSNAKFLQDAQAEHEYLKASGLTLVDLREANGSK